MFRVSDQEKIQEIILELNQYIENMKTIISDFVDVNFLIHTIHLNSLCYVERIFISLSNDSYNKLPRDVYPQMRKDLYRLNYIEESVFNMMTKSYIDFSENVSSTLSENEFLTKRDEILLILESFKEKRIQFENIIQENNISIKEIDIIST